jgi:transposase
MYKQITIQTLHTQGMKKSEIARTLGCHRNTILKVLNRKKVIEKQTRVKPSIFDQKKDQIKKWLDEKVTKFRIYEKLRDECGIYSTYVNLCIYVKKHFPKPIEAFGVQITAPGEEAELDFGYLGILPGPLGIPVKTWGLVVVLSHSRDAYYAICYDQKLETLCREIQNAFEYFGGVPLRLKIDNMRVAILKNQHYDLQFNQDFLEFANHFGTVIIPCEPYHPEQKGKVESGVKYVQINFINGRTFKDTADLRQQLRNWMDNYANKRVHGTTRKVPYEVLLNIERPALQPLPENPFAFFNRGVRTVAPNCHIHFENNYYSVPFKYVGKEVTVRWNEALLRIIFEGEQIVLHPKAEGQGNYVTVRNHLPDYKVYSESERQVKYETKMRDIGEDAHEYFRWLLEKKEPYWFQIVRGIFGLQKTYGSDAVNRALKRALGYQVRNVGTIRNILEKKLYLEKIEPKLLDTEKIIFLREDNPLCRDLSYYSGRL